MDRALRHALHGIAEPLRAFDTLGLLELAQLRRVYWGDEVQLCRIQEAVMARVFVSFAMADLQVAARHRDFLCAQGHQVFLANHPQDGIGVGQDWEDQLVDRLAWCSAILCLVSPAYQTSEWCSAETGIARAFGCRILPVRLIPGLEHPLLRRYQAMDVGSDADRRLLEELRRIDTGGEAGWDTERSPYPGLAAFDETFQRVFFGRHKEVEELGALLRSPRWGRSGGIILLTGPSGCGKSSLLRAGLVPLMRSEPGWWVLPVFTPGRVPHRSLAMSVAAASRQLRLDWSVEECGHRVASPNGLREVTEELLAAAPGHAPSRLLMVVDQFEEVLTLAADDQLSVFLDMLRSLPEIVRVVGAVRPEYLARLLAAPELADVLARPVPIGPLSRQALPSVITGPARLAGIHVEEALVDRMVQETGEGEALPLLAYTLAHVADGVRRGGTLSIQTYEALGGVRGAMTHQAELALAAACRVRGRSPGDVVLDLLRLVTVDGHGNPSRRRVLKADLPDALAAELDEFVARRLLRTGSEDGQTFLEVVHEKFTSAWPPMTTAIEENSIALHAQRRVEQAARVWDETHRPRHLLAPGGMLQAHLNGLDAHPVRQSGWTGPFRRRRIDTRRVTLSLLETTFLTMSYRRDRFRRARTISALSALLVIAVVVSFVIYSGQRTAERQRNEAQLQAKRALANSLVARSQSLLDSRPGHAQLLAVAALNEATTPEATINALDAMTAHMVRSRQVGEHQGNALQVRFSPHRKGLILSSGSDGWASLWDTNASKGTVTSKAVRAVLPGDSANGEGIVPAAEFSPLVEGRVAIGGTNGGIRIWDIQFEAGNKSSAKYSLDLPGHKGWVTRAKFSPTDRSLLASASTDHTVRLWNVDVKQDNSMRVLEGHKTPVRGLAFSSSGDLLASGDEGGEVRVWSTYGRSGSIMRVELESPVMGLDFSPDGRILAAASFDGAVRLLETTTGRLLRVKQAHGDKAVLDVKFSPKGGMLGTAGADNRAVLWDASTLEEAHVLAGHTDYVESIDFSPLENGLVATAGNDGEVRLWDLNSKRLQSIDTPFSRFWFEGHISIVYDVAFSPYENSLLASAGHDGNTVLWHASGDTDVLRGHDGEISTVAFSPHDRDLILTAGADGDVRIWKISTKETMHRLSNDGQVVDAAFLPSNPRFVAAITARHVRVWRYEREYHSSQLVADLDGSNCEFSGLAVSPTDGTIALSCSRGGVWIWDGRSSRPTKILNGGRGSAVAYSHDGRWIASANVDGTISMWDARSFTLSKSLQGRHVGPIFKVEFSPDGTTLATTGSDRQVRIWDVSMGRSLAVVAPHKGGSWGLGFSNDGKLVAVTGGDGRIVLVPHPRYWHGELCYRAGGNMSLSEWRVLFGDRKYFRLCGTYPAGSQVKDDAPTIPEISF